MRSNGKEQPYSFNFCLHHRSPEGEHQTGTQKVHGSYLTIFSSNFLEFLECHQGQLSPEDLAVVTKRTPTTYQRETFSFRAVITTVQ